MARVADPTNDDSSDIRLKIGQVFVAIGDSVSAGSRLFELETHNATMEFPSTIAGKVVRMDIRSGDEFSMGELEHKIARLIKIQENR